MHKIKTKNNTTFSNHCLMIIMMSSCHVTLVRPFGVLIFGKTRLLAMLVFACFRYTSLCNNCDYWRQLERSCMDGKSRFSVALLGLCMCLSHKHIHFGGHVLLWKGG